MRLSSVLVAVSLLALEKVSRTRDNSTPFDLLSKADAKVFGDAVACVGEWMREEDTSGLLALESLLSTRPALAQWFREWAIPETAPTHLYFGMWNDQAPWEEGSVVERRGISHWTTDPSVAFGFADGAYCAIAGAVVSRSDLLLDTNTLVELAHTFRSHPQARHVREEIPDRVLGEREVLAEGVSATVLREFSFRGRESVEALRGELLYARTEEDFLNLALGRRPEDVALAVSAICDIDTPEWLAAINKVLHGAAESGIERIWRERK